MTVNARFLLFPVITMSVLISSSCGGTIPGPPIPTPQPSLELQAREVITADGSYNSAPGIVEASNGDYVLSYRKGTGHVLNPFVAMRRSTDKGQTWGAETIEFDTSGPDPSLARTPNGDLILEFVKKDPNSVSGAAYSRSTDNGLTWGSFTFYTNPVSDISAFPTRFINVGADMYAVSFGPNGGNPLTAKLWKSVDDGLTWSIVSTIASGVNETAIERLSGTTLITIQRADDELHTYSQISSDLGATWGTQTDITAQVGVLHLPQLIAVRDTLVLFGRDKNAKALVAFTSIDAGKSWANRLVIEAYTGQIIDGGYCWPIPQADGKLYVVYYADSNNLRQPDIKAVTVRVQ